MRVQSAGYVSIVWPGMNQVEGMACDASNARMRSAPTAPNSPCEIGVGVVMPRAIQSDSASKSKVRHTRWRGMGRPPRGCGAYLIPLLSKWDERVVGIHERTQVGEPRGEMRQGMNAEPGQQEAGTDERLEE